MGGTAVDLATKNPCSKEHPEPVTHTANWDATAPYVAWVDGLRRSFPFKQSYQEDKSGQTMPYGDVTWSYDVCAWPNTPFSAADLCYETASFERSAVQPLLFLRPSNNAGSNSCSLFPSSETFKHVWTRK